MSQQLPFILPHDVKFLIFQLQSIDLFLIKGQPQCAHFPRFFFHLLLYRFGKAKMESKLRELFGHNMEETGREGGEIDFSQFLDSFEKSQLNTVRAIILCCRYVFLVIQLS